MDELDCSSKDVIKSISQKTEKQIADILKKFSNCFPTVQEAIKGVKFTNILDALNFLMTEINLLCNQEVNFTDPEKFVTAFKENASLLVDKIDCVKYEHYKDCINEIIELKHLSKLFEVTESTDVIWNSSFQGDVLILCCDYNTFIKDMDTTSLNIKIILERLNELHQSLNRISSLETRININANKDLLTYISDTNQFSNINANPLSIFINSIYHDNKLFFETMFNKSGAGKRTKQLSNNIAEIKKMAQEFIDWGKKDLQNKSRQNEQIDSVINTNLSTLDAVTKAQLGVKAQHAMQTLDLFEKAINEYKAESQAYKDTLDQKINTYRNKPNIVSSLIQIANMFTQFEADIEKYVNPVNQYRQNLENVFLLTGQQPQAQPQAQQQAQMMQIDDVPNTISHAYESKPMKEHVRRDDRSYKLNYNEIFKFLFKNELNLAYNNSYFLTVISNQIANLITIINMKASVYENSFVIRESYSQIEKTLISYIDKDTKFVFPTAIDTLFLEFVKEFLIIEINIEEKFELSIEIILLNMITYYLDNVSSNDIKMVVLKEQISDNIKNHILILILLFQSIAVRLNFFRVKEKYLKSIFLVYILMFTEKQVIFCNDDQKKTICENMEKFASNVVKVKNDSLELNHKTFSLMMMPSTTTPTQKHIQIIS